MKGIKDAAKNKPMISVEDVENKRTRADTTSSQFQSMNVDDLLNMLKETKSIHDEADILHYLFETKFV